MCYFCDGRASLVVGTYTHLPTSDHRSLAGGTAFMTDAGMTGDFDSVIGMVKDEPLSRFLRKLPGSKFEAAGGPATLCGVAVETDDKTGLAVKVGAVRLGGVLEEALPKFSAYGPALTKFFTTPAPRYHRAAPAIDLAGLAECKHPVALDQPVCDFRLQYRVAIF